MLALILAQPRHLTMTTSILDQSECLFQRAQQHLVGGVNSPVRAFHAVGGSPRFIASAKGATLYDADGQALTDFVASWGPMILGHNHPDVVAAIIQQAQRGTSYGAPHQQEIELAEIVAAKMPSIEKMRMTSSGTEATMSAVRLARAHTGRNKIIKFAGCYHGHADVFLVDAGSGALTHGHPSSPGIPSDCSQHTLIAQYNNFDDVSSIFADNADNIAAIIVEPIAANMNVVLPQAGFLQFLRDISQQYGALLIFDEIITGFRIHPGGAQELFNIKPDLSTLGKILGGGLPAAAFGGRADIMAQLSPEGPVYQAGTLSGNPLALSAGCATLQLLDNACYQHLETLSCFFATELQKLAERYHFPLQVIRQGSLLGLHFVDQEKSNNAQRAEIDSNAYASFFQHMLARGHYFAPSAFEACFISTAHTMEQLECCLNDVEYFFKRSD